MKLCKGTEVKCDGRGTLGHVISCGRKYAVVRFANATMRLRVTELEVVKR